MNIRAKNYLSEGKNIFNAPLNINKCYCLRLRNYIAILVYYFGFVYCFSLFSSHIQLRYFYLSHHGFYMLCFLLIIM